MSATNSVPYGDLGGVSNGLKLLVFTQAVDKNDPVLGFFHEWIRALSVRCESVHVVCLRKGAHDLPANVKVYSLGKEESLGRAAYVTHFYKYLWALRDEHDAVFVHMNPEYVLLGGILWRLMGKRVYLWRNHWKKSMITALAVFLSHKSFCTSKASYITRFKKNVLMPVGIDTIVFKPTGAEREVNSILSLGRIAPSKHIEVLLEALAMLRDENIAYRANIYGSALPKDAAYLEGLKEKVNELGIGHVVHFHGAVVSARTPAVYSAHEIFVNMSGSGMFDKTIFEAIACGATTLASSADYADVVDERFTFKQGNALDLAQKIDMLLKRSNEEKEADFRDLQKLVAEHSLERLADRLVEEMHG